MSWSPPLIDAIREHARREFPRESCGLVIREPGGAERYVPCRNLADGQTHFIAAPEDIAEAEAQGELIAVAHSHPNSAPEPSQADRVMMERWGVPWIIINVPVGHWRVWEPSGYRPSLIGREFSHGVLDCYALVKDHFAEALGIALPEFEREDDWWRKGSNLYLDNFSAAGFVDVTLEEMRPHDCPLIALNSKVPNHAAVYLGDDVILHHVMRRLSRREVYSGYWKRHTRRVVRHRELC